MEAAVRPAGTAAGSSTGGSAGTSSIIITDGHLTNSAGRTIYLWVADTAGKSTCSGACAAVWPAVPGNDKAGAGVSAAKLTTIKGAGGGTQLAYAGHPLYYFASDTSAGQVTGQGSAATASAQVVGGGCRRQRGHNQRRCGRGAGHARGIVVGRIQWWRIRVLTRRPKLSDRLG